MHNYLRIKIPEDNFIVQRNASHLLLCRGPLNPRRRSLLQILNTLVPSNVLISGIHMASSFCYD